ncbi:MAG: hypothetical protein OHK0038_08930 [Flammeovirgaceae bacterium]
MDMPVENQGTKLEKQSPYFAQDLKNYSATITVDDLKKHLSILASDEYEGRETGTKGQKMAAEYIYKKFKDLGLKGVVLSNTENPYYQTFELAKSTWGEGYIQTKSKKLVIFEDLFPYGEYSTPAKNVELVFAGYGLDHEKYSDYKSLDVKGKGVLVLRGEPKDENGNYLISGTKNESEISTSTNKVKIAKEKGAAFVIIAYETDADFAGKNAMYKQYYMQPSIDFDDPNAGKIGLFFTSPSNLAFLLGTTPEKFQNKLKKLQAKGGNAAGKFKSKVEIKLERKKTSIMTENVLGFLEGTDLKDEVLVITSHYDHIGIGRDGKINNGADDDGSGTVGLLEIAEAFSKAASEGKRPRRSILFMTVTGEEKGLLGSEYYSNNPIFPLDKTVTNLNIDMIGRTDERHSDNQPYVYIIGSDMLSSELHQIHEETAKEFAPQMQMDYLYNTKDSPERFYYRSDHYNFAKHGIPIIFYFNGVHADYHRPTDDVDKINFDLLAQRAQLVFATAWQIANRDSKPKVDKPVSKDE